MKIIGLSGRAGSGKDTIADIILEHRTGVRLSFAWPIKHMIAVGFGISLNDLNNQTMKNAKYPSLNGRTLREAMTSLGTDWAHGFLGKDVWVNQVKNRIDQIYKQDSFTDGVEPVIIVTDVRFDTEATMLRELGADIIHVDAVNRLRSASQVPLPPGSPVPVTHISEKGIEMLPGETILNNNGTLEDLRDTLQTVGLIL